MGCAPLGHSILRLWRGPSPRDLAELRVSRTSISHWFCKCIWMLRVEYFIADHNGDKVLGFREVDDIVRPSRNHVDGFDFIPGDFKFDCLSGIDISFLNKAMTGNDDEDFPLAVVPVLAFGDTGAADIDRYLPAVVGMHQLGEEASLVHIHLEISLEFPFRQICQVKREECLLKGTRFHGRHQECLWLFFEHLQKIDDAAKGNFMSPRHAAEFAIAVLHKLSARIVLAMDFPAFQEVVHSFDEVIDIEQLELGISVIHREGLVIGYRPAECADGTVILRTAVPHEVRETVNCHFCSRFLSIREEKIFPRFLAPAIWAISEASGECRLNG
mgnify:CR=1 FL=1